MNWYIAKLVFRIVCGDGEHTPQFDEQLWLVSAKNEQEALQKARINGTLEAKKLSEEDGDIVKWEFIDIADVQKLSSLEDGVSLYSKSEEAEDATMYIDYVKFKAQSIEHRAFMN